MEDPRRSSAAPDAVPEDAGSGDGRPVWWAARGRARRAAAADPEEQTERRTEHLTERVTERQDPRQDSGRSLTGRSRDTLRLLRPPSDAELDRALSTPPAPTRLIRPPGGVVGAVDRFQRRHRLIGFPLAVAYKFADDQGAFLAATLAYYGFVSLFPLLLLLVSITGFVLHGDPQLQAKLLNSALRDVPVIGDQLRSSLSIKGSGVGLTVGAVGTLYGSLGLAQAGQTVFNRLNSVPRNTRPNPIRSRLRSLRLIPILGLLLIVSSTLTAFRVRASVGSLHLGPGLHLTAIAVSITVNIVLFLLAFRLLTARATPIREVIVGATIAGVAWQALQFGGAVYVAHHLDHAQEVYGVFAVVLGSITWIYVEALVVVVCVEINVVLQRRLWPRALLTPFTDDVELTPADRRAYAGYARAERFKGFERIAVDFDGVPEEE